ncbi:hypothetical protein HPP92_028206 [Vanilla planifolia]|uniref:NAC domain-containing protein n=1 Tax=Vanilla planifolia TaxID=51239 RepID=A0A835P6X4_VANPL|nr:hypothetical protein HPP92_028206 [Vanilla planifolia]
MAVVEDDNLVLPPGFRFHPTDEEIITHYLSPKVLNPEFTARAMGDVDLNKQSKDGRERGYFFCQRDRKYPTGTRTNRATESGYWKATGKDKEIHRGRGILVGMKKTLVFYLGRAPNGEKTNWVMHEFRLEPNSRRDEWIVCKVFHKNTTGPKRSSLILSSGTGGQLIDYPALPPLMDATYYPSDDGLDFKATMAMPSYFSSMFAVDDINMSNINLPPPPVNTNFSFPPESGYIHGDDGPLVAPSPSSPRFGGRCKAEQFSNQSMLSQDTCISADHHTEISSVISNDINAVPTSVGGGANGVLDLRHMWRC